MTASRLGAAEAGVANARADTAPSNPANFFSNLASIRFVPNRQTARP